MVDDLPKTRSGKIMRRILRKILSGEEDSLGDISTVSEGCCFPCYVLNKLSVHIAFRSGCGGNDYRSGEGVEEQVRFKDESDWSWLSCVQVSVALQIIPLVPYNGNRGRQRA